jgi:hypothetical protein
MPQAGIRSRARRRDSTPWWEELDREAFRFPIDYEPEPARRTVAVAARPDVAGEPMIAVAEPIVAVAEPTVAPAERRLAAGTGPRVADGERRTVIIRGRGAERNLPVARPTMRRHERPGFKADRAALWAVMLGLLLILVAATSAHAAILH